MTVALNDLSTVVGKELGPGDWTAIDQRRIDLFATATDDHQWIHTDPTRAAEGPFGTTVAHGYLTLSLIPHLAGGMLAVPDARLIINYGLNRCRFPAPVTVGSRVRATAEVLSVDEVDGQGIQVSRRVTVHIEGEQKPACVAEVVTRYYP